MDPPHGADGASDLRQEDARRTRFRRQPEPPGSMAWCYSPSTQTRGCSSMVEPQFSKLMTRVRSPSAARSGLAAARLLLIRTPLSRGLHPSVSHGDCLGLATPNLPLGVPFVQPHPSELPAWCRVRVISIGDPMELLSHWISHPDRCHRSLQTHRFSRSLREELIVHS